jgi:hypothetical protein
VIARLVSTANPAEVAADFPAVQSHSRFLAGPVDREENGDSVSVPQGSILAAQARRNHFLRYMIHSTSHSSRKTDTEN